MAGPIKFTISIVNNAIDIDAGGKKGGNVRGKILQRVQWIRPDGAGFDRFDLTFERYDGEGAVTTKRDWPFLEGKAGGSGSDVKDDEGKVEKATTFKARLAEPGVYKYTVKAYTTPEGGGPGTVWVLDPAIIIDE